YDVLRLGLAEGPGAPQAELQDDVLELPPVLGELVGDAGGWSGQEAAPDDAGVLQLPEPGRQDVGWDPGEAAPEVGEALGTEEEVADHEQRPALAHQFQRVGQAAELAIRPVAHLCLFWHRLDFRERSCL